MKEREIRAVQMDFMERSGRVQRTDSLTIEDIKQSVGIE